MSPVLVNGSIRMPIYIGDRLKIVLSSLDVSKSFHKALIYTDIFMEQSADSPGQGFFPIMISS